MIRHLVNLPRALSTQSVQFLEHTSMESHLFRCNKRIRDLCKLGKVDDARNLFDKMSQRDSVSWDTMISGYSQNNRIMDAQILFDAFGGKNVRTWTAMLTGYAKVGQLEEAWSLFDSMPEKNVISWNALITGCLQNRCLVYAKKLFDVMPQRDIVSWNTMITGYCHAGMMKEAMVLFEQMLEKNPVSWTVMISGYVEIGSFVEAWNVFGRMHQSGLMPDQPMFVVALLAVIGVEALDLVDSLRSLVIKTGYEKDVVIGTATLNAYARSGRLDIANDFFNKMPQRNEYSWSTMIAAFSQGGRLDDAIAVYKRILEPTISSQTAMVTAYAQNGRIVDAKGLFREIQNPDIITWNAMIAGFSQNGMIDEAKDAFEHMPRRNLASWAAMISGLAQNERCEEALYMFSELHSLGDFPTHYCFTSCIFASASLGAFETGKQIHALAVKRRCQHNPFVSNALISMYSKCKNIEDVSQVFGTMGIKDTVAWNSLITGLSNNYMLEKAREIFEKMPERDVVSWTAIISAYVQAGDFGTALHLFSDMLARGSRPNELTITSILSACGSAGAIKLGEQIHGLLNKLGFKSCLFVNNALITMYFKFGSEGGFSVFEDMAERDLVTWNAVLAGCAHNGLGKEAIEIFRRMEVEGVLPDQISFLGILCACSRAGLLEEGRAYLNSMCKDFGIKPLVYHYTCMVDLLGRAGQLSEAEALVESMPVEPDSVIWEALLGACRIHNNIEIAERVAKRLFRMNALESGTYVLLSNLYASHSRWDKVEGIRERMKVQGMRKEPATSWIHIKNKLYTFHTDDKGHDFVEDIHKLLEEYYGRLKLSGYVPKTEFVLHDVEEEQKHNQLLYHSEKLALAFGIMNTPNGSPILILKNLRICGDCHTFMKFMSNVTQRKIVIRDRKRFHHFQDGACSCGEYW
ncbi:pentatricopeptide repeat-containing protein At4g02750-like [Beta vulgaris subsp. vulgaris]|uniref:pentatricopeptide repeat-containing protein At4g02750-like n=1 Tax=Beta vulgaris subsp. vulgaris TaxID=3555 RepID=UPI00203703B0|nr:pentatricopeptide repeat-containing protein At4g02750-like [Beta vulgaris subsp. vulgaris]